MKYLLTKTNRIYEAQKTFHYVDSLLKQIELNYNSIANVGWYRGWSDQARKLDLRWPVQDFKYGDPVIVSESFEEWLTRRGRSELLWEYFVNSLVAHENLPDFKDVKSLIESSTWWNFRNKFLDFSFATSFDRPQDHCVMSMNPIVADTELYLGTITDVLAEYGNLPHRVIFLANNCSPTQQMRLNQILKYGQIYNDHQGCIMYMPDVRWDILYI